MFKKSFKVKSNCQLKSSEKKKLQAAVASCWTLNKDEASVVVPLKEAIYLLRVLTSSSEQVMVYMCNETPLFFEYNGEFYPSVYLLWKCPLAVPSVSIYPGVIEKLCNGADLMIPGINREHNAKVYSTKDLPPRTKVYLNTEGNSAALAVGLSVVSIAEMLVPGSKGKGVYIFHTFGDELCKLKEVRPLLPQIPFTRRETLEDIVELNTKKDVPHDTINEENGSSQIPDILLSTAGLSLSPVPELEESNPELTMEELLFYCFTKCLKTTVIKATFPILTNIFYKMHMMEALPPHLSLDIKKTKYKKLSQFLIEMHSKGIIALEDSKGVQSITSVNFAHEDILNFQDPFENVDQPSEEPSLFYEIVEKKVINGAVESFFSRLRRRKGESLGQDEVRKFVTQYVKEYNLVNESSKTTVLLDNVLRTTLKCKEMYLPWKEVMDGISDRMGDCYEICTPDKDVISGKGKLLPLEVYVLTKTSNKKVTLVNNLECYGINVGEFAKECQRGLAASTTINEKPNSKSAQFQIQGNHMIFIEKLLTEKYTIPKKFIRVVDNEKKSKKEERK